MRYYLVFLLAFACAISVLVRDEVFCDFDQLESESSGGGSDDGEDDKTMYTSCEMTFNQWGRSFYHLGNTAYKLVAQSLSGEIGSATDYDGLSPTIRFVHDGVQVWYSVLVILLMLNLFIAMVTYTYDEYQAKSSALLLLEKYNMMGAEEELLIIYDDWMHKCDHIFGSHAWVARKLLEWMAGERCENGESFVNSARAKYAIQSGGRTFFESHTADASWWNGEEMGITRTEAQCDDKGAMSHLRSTTLLLIDPQNDFHDSTKENFTFHSGGSLSVPGSAADAERIVAIIKGRDGDYKTFHDIYVTLDCHSVNDIGHQHFWVSGTAPPGEVIHPAPWTQISYSDVKERKWVPRNPKLYHWALYYTKRLKTTEVDNAVCDGKVTKSNISQKFSCTVWPTHCVVGTHGFAVYKPIYDALTQWSIVNHRTINYIRKGSSRLTEMYSALKAEVPIPNKTRDLLAAFGLQRDKSFQDMDLDETRMELYKRGYLGQEDTEDNTHLNEQLLGDLMLSGNLVVAGQALSHCLNYTVRDLMRHWALPASHIVILSDASSSVPGCEAWGQQFLDDMIDEGVNVVKTFDFLDDGSVPLLMSLSPRSWDELDGAGDGGYSADHLQTKKHGIITGKNFRLGACKVFFGSQVCELRSITKSTVVFVVPPIDIQRQDTNRCGVVHVYVQCGTRKSVEVNFTYHDSSLLEEE
jgi:nicotinamidase-related amidase